MLQSSQLFDGAKQRFLDALLAAARVEVYLPNVSTLPACATRGVAVSAAQKYATNHGELHCTANLMSLPSASSVLISHNGADGAGERGRQGEGANWQLELKASNQFIPSGCPAVLQVELVSEGDSVNELFVVVSGTLSCYRTSSGANLEVGVPFLLSPFT